MDDKMRDALERVIDYNWADEAADYQEMERSGADTEHHIFNDLKALDAYLKEERTLAMPNETVAYDDQPASWREGYDDFYDWESDDSDAVPQYLNEPRIGTDERSAVSYPQSDHAEYHRGWDHANYENAYKGYKLAKGGPDA